MSDFTFDFDSFSDLYKDTYNVRPRGHRFFHPETTDEERQVMWDNLLIEHERSMDQYQAAIDAADETFEKQIATNINYGAPDRETAIRWIIDGYQIEDYDLRDDGFGWFQYHSNVSDKYRAEITNIIEKYMLTMLEN